MSCRRGGEQFLSGWPVRSFEWIPPGDAGTIGSTVPWMRQLVREGRDDPRVAAYARALVEATPHLHPVEAVFRHAQSMPYAYDEDILARAGVDADASELLQGAPYQVGKTLLGGTGANVGDCDDRAILVQSLLGSLGVPTRFVLVRGPGRPDFSHVYSEAKVDGAGWVPLDTIMDGLGGRPLFGPGQEVGPPLARDRVTVEVDGVSWAHLALLAAAYLWWRSR